MRNQTLSLKKIIITCSVLTISACNQSEVDQNQHVISNSIEVEKSNEVVTSISGSIPMISSDSVEADNSLSDSTSNKQLVQNVELSSIDNEIDTQDTDVSKPNDVVQDTSELAKTTESPIAQTEFAKPEDKTELESQTAAQRILAEILDEKAVIDYSQVSLDKTQKEKVSNFCKKINARLSSVSYKDCLASNHKLSPFNSVNGQPIVVTEFPPKENREPLGRVLIIGGTHGDELTSVSTAYKWIDNLNQFHSGLFHWHIAPVINPDGVLPRPAKRTNANGVDINRNLPTPDWEKQSLLRWEKSDKNARRNPGTKPASEPETQWIMHEIATFKPDAIISIHAPYGILDFDSPKLKTAPSKFGKLKLNLLGTYPGSLGNYAGIEKQIPVLTLELPNAQYMPPKEEIDAIWTDMIRWLKKRLNK